MIICGTGHRSQKIGGWNIPNPIYNKVYSATINLLVELKPSKVISGMALGFDMIIANAALELKIPLLAAIPFTGQENIWPQHSKDEYNRVKNLAAEVVIISPGGYSAEKMQIRNKWMVDNANDIIACLDGSAGGTANCVKYAESINKKIYRINPKDL